MGGQALEFRDLPTGYADDDDDQARTQAAAYVAWQQQQQQQTGGYNNYGQEGGGGCGWMMLCVAGVACAIFTVLLIYALSSTSVGLIGGDCPMLWQVMASRCILAAVLCICVIAFRMCGCAQMSDMSGFAMMATYGFLFLFFAGFAVAEGVVAFRSTVNNSACVTVLQAQSVTGTAMLGILGWAGMVGDIMMAVCLLMSWYLDFGSAMVDPSSSYAPVQAAV